MWYKSAGCVNPVIIDLKKLNKSTSVCIFLFKTLKSLMLLLYATSLIDQTHTVLIQFNIKHITNRIDITLGFAVTLSHVQPALSP